jgi:hypothetical protein
VRGLLLGWRVATDGFAAVIEEWVATFFRAPQLSQVEVLNRRES